MAEIDNRNKWVIGQCKDFFTDKEFLRQQSIFQMLNKTTRMFKYEGLPETIPVKDLETQLQVGGHATFAEVNGELYSFRSGLGGKPNPYYLPTLSVISNPALNFNKSLEIDKECVVMLNDHYYQGLMPLFNRYASLLVEAEISLKYAILNARIPALIQADNDNAYESAVEFISQVVNGEKYGVISTNGEFFEGIKTHEFLRETHITDLIESIQYIKGSWYNELGLNASFNMKREAINEAEAALNEDILYPSIDTMLESRKIGVEKVNNMYGTNISVELDSIWAINRKQDKLAIDQIKAEIDDVKTDDVKTEETEVIEDVD